MHVVELPRDENGTAIGQWRLRHRNPDYSDDLGAACFRGGVTVKPLEGRDLDRIVAALGEDLSLEPWDAPSEPHRGAQEPETGNQASERESAPPAPRQPASAAQITTPTSEQELLGLSEEQLRDLAAELGATDRRWKVQKLRRFIADELSIELGENV